eukprot:Gb_37674 [translate_table: standard]
MESSAMDMAQVLLTAFDTSMSKYWREEDRRWRAEDRVWRDEDIKYRQEERDWRIREKFMRESEMKYIPANNLSHLAGWWMQRFAVRHSLRLNGMIEMKIPHSSMHVCNKNCIIECYSSAVCIM